MLIFIVAAVATCVTTLLTIINTWLSFRKTRGKDDRLHPHHPPTTEEQAYPQEQQEGVNQQEQQ